MGVVWPVITENSCDDVVMTTEYSRVNTVMSIMPAVFPSQGGLWFHPPHHYLFTRAIYDVVHGICYSSSLCYHVWFRSCDAKNLIHMWQKVKWLPWLPHDIFAMAPYLKNVQGLTLYSCTQFHAFMKKWRIVLHIVKAISRSRNSPLTMTLETSCCARGGCVASLSSNWKEFKHVWRISSCDWLQALRGLRI